MLRRLIQWAPDPPRRKTIRPHIRIKVHIGIKYNNLQIRASLNRPKHNAGFDKLRARSQNGKDSFHLFLQDLIIES